MRDTRNPPGTVGAGSLSLSGYAASLSPLFVTNEQHSLECPIVIGPKLDIDDWYQQPTETEERDKPWSWTLISRQPLWVKPSRGVAFVGGSSSVHNSAQQWQLVNYVLFGWLILSRYRSMKGWIRTPLSARRNKSAQVMHQSKGIQRIPSRAVRGKGGDAIRRSEMPLQGSSADFDSIFPAIPLMEHFFR